MSDPPVNDHLAGILSDFEALKRSFDNEDIDDMASFTSASPVSDPISPSSCHFILGHSKECEAQGGVIQTPSFAFNNNSIRSEAHPHIGVTSNPIPAFKSRAVGSSLSFNRGTMNRPVIHNNGSSVTRAASFQCKLNPKICSQLSGPGSDNDSLHSSTSSLEYSGGGGYLFPTNKLVSYHSPLHQREYQGSHFQHPQVVSNIKTLFSRESGFKSEMNPEQGMVLNIKEPQEVNQGSLSNLDYQIPIEGEGLQRGGNKFSPGIKFIDANINWKSLQNVSSFGEGGIKKVHQQGSQDVKTLKPRAKEIQRLNKFPLDLDSLVISTSPKKVEAASTSPDTTKVSSHILGGLQHIHSAPSTASTSASLSSLDSSSDTPCHSFNTTFLPLSPCSPVPPHSSIPVPEISSSVPLSPSDNFQLNILSESEIVYVVPNLHSPSSSSNNYSSRPIESVEDGRHDASDTVDLILQRIASFSWPATTDTQTSVAQSPTVIQSNGGSSSKFGCPIETTSTTAWKQGKKKYGETTGELEADSFTPMEEEKVEGIMREENEDGVKNHKQANIQTFEAQNENCGKDDTQLVENGKETGMETGDMKEEASVNMVSSPSDPGFQTSFKRGSDLFGYVGIDAVLDQIRDKTIKAGFEFNIMVVVYLCPCLLTFIFLSLFSVIEEKGVKMKLTVIDTPGFGDQINNENCWEPIVKYVNEQYEKYLREELKINRKRRIPDSRVHCCIYFLPATGHRLRPIDIEFMKRLGNIVSILPVIAKADTLTVEERQEFKDRIKQDLLANGICVYPQREHDEDPEERTLNDRIRENIPYAVVGTDKEHQVNGNKVLGRKTKWGIIEVENVAHCEFANLRDLLIRSHLQDLKDVTHNIHYETYRVQRLNESNMNFNELVLSTWPLENGTDKCETESQL
ncbi:uncharacterized protein LOC106529447 [Austrofundulus limnaeus]|uniref:Uncharacterized protein LOC106529447 n=1 Tax=Austrofundulus limnaeus TaxID=52670 RepID=A0A2I4CK05_AUSLI|nr:PREDICTED: uncharacterized protein LOC106529447 [Austrofundulus limnaeus]